MFHALVKGGHKSRASAGMATMKRILVYAASRYILQAVVERRNEMSRIPNRIVNIPIVMDLLYQIRPATRWGDFYEARE